MVGIVINRYNAIVEAQKNPAPREIALIQLNKNKLNADTDRNTIVNERGVKESPQRVPDDEASQHFPLTMCVKSTRE